jgi:DNA-binding beta-propeller fold protein YncE
MKNKQRNGFTKIGLGLIFLFCAFPYMWAGDGQGGSQSETDLVWPMPPEQPRIRFVQKIALFGEVKGFQKPKKLSFFERLAGAKAPKVVEHALGRPYGIAVDSRDRIFVADAARKSIVVFDRANRTVEEWGRGRRGILNQPMGVSIDANDNVYVSDLQRKIIYVYNNDGALVSQLGFGVLDRPAGLAVDRKREILYVADPGLKQVLAFSLKDNTLVRRIGNSDRSSKKGVTFDSPANVAVDKKGFVYVTDQLGRRLYVFNRRGRLHRKIGEYGTSVGSFAFPKGVGVDSQDNVYVADAWFNNFQIFNSKGETLLFVGERGKAPGQFTLLAGLHVDHKDRIYATDFTGRLQIFQLLIDPDKENNQGGGADKQGL